MNTLNQIIDSAIKNKFCVVDVEHSPDTDVNYANFSLWGVSFFPGENPVYLKSKADYTSVLYTIFNEDIDIVNHNIKFDLKCIKQYTGVDYPKNPVDTMIAMNLIDESRRDNQLGLKTLVKDLFGYQMKEFADASSFGKDSPEFEKYTLDDVIWTAQLWKMLQPKLIDQKVDRLFRRILMPSVKLFADMELNGIGWNNKKAGQFLTEYETKIASLEVEIKKVLGETINLNSPDQLTKKLFDDLGYSSKGLPYTKGGVNKAPRPKLDEEVLEKLAPKIPICSLLLERRKYTKIISTYIKPSIARAEINADSRIHATYWLTSTTGRTRSDKPNLQNIPNIKDKNRSIKALFVPREGFLFGCADMSQIELRIGARISGDANLKKAYTDYFCTGCGETGTSEKILHTCPKCGLNETEKVLKDKNIKGFWHGLDVHQQTTDNIRALNGDRQNGKTTNFALLYNATARRLNEITPAMSVDQWEQVRTEYFKYYDGIYLWHKQVKFQMESNLGIQDLFGRKLRITKADLARHIYKHTYNRVINFPVQASACHYTLLGASKCKDELIEKGHWNKNIFFTNFVHDEVDFEVSKDHKNEIHEIIRRHLEEAVSLQIPIRVDIKYGESWHEAKG